MNESGYVWFLNEVDRTTLMFRPAHALYVVFNNPSMQATYRAYYGRIRNIRVDCIRLDRAWQ